MDYQMLVKNLFNDMFVFFNGTQPLGLEPLIDVYQDEPLLMALIGRLDEAVKVPYNDVMKECYAFYKQYAGGDFTDEVWEQIVKDIQDFNQKWQNPWCRGIILALLELLEQEDKERQELQSQGTLAEDATQEPGFTETEGQNGICAGGRRGNRLSGNGIWRGRAAGGRPCSLMICGAGKI